MNNLTIYLADDCHQCQVVSDYISNSGLTIEVVKLTGKAMEESGLFVFPAMKQGDKVVAYGEDIIPRLENFKNN